MPLKDSQKFAVSTAAMVAFAAFVVYNYGFTAETNQKLTYGVLTPK